jgi:hypothetical protein
MGRCIVSDIPGYRRTPVTALDAVSGIPQAIHENDQCFRHTFRAPTASRRWSRESKPRKRRNDDVECRTIFVFGIGERLDQREKFKDRTRPAVDQHQRYRVSAGRALMDKINLLSINFGSELVKAVDLRFSCTPVVIVLSIIRQFSDLFDVRAVLPRRARKSIGPQSPLRSRAGVPATSVIMRG